MADEGGATPAKRHKIGGAAIADKIISDVGFWPNPDLETFKSAVAAVVDYEYMVRPSLFFLLPRSLRCVFHPPSKYCSIPSIKRRSEYFHCIDGAQKPLSRVSFILSSRRRIRRMRRTPSLPTAKRRTAPSRTAVARRWPPASASRSSTAAYSTPSGSRTSRIRPGVGTQG